MSPTLVETETALREALDKITYDELDEAAHFEVLRVIEQAVTTAEDKRDRVAMFLRRAQTEADFLEEEAVALADKASRIRKEMARLKAYVLGVMDFMKVKELNGRTHRFVRVQNPSHVEILDDKLVPQEYVRVRTEVIEVPDKKRLAEVLKSGQEVPGVTLVPGQYRLEIR